MTDLYCIITRGSQQCSVALWQTLLQLLSMVTRVNDWSVAGSPGKNNII